jgi:prefoldin subunit 5
MGVYDQIKSAFQDIIAPELHAIRADIQRLDQKIDSVDARISARLDAHKSEIQSLKAELLSHIQRLEQKIDSLKAELLSEIRRLDTRIDSLDRELKTAIDLRERLVAVEARLATSRQ